MRRNGRFDRGALRLAGTAAAGVLAGHFVGYRLVFPGSPQRHAVLVETGHGYFPLAIRVAAMLAVVAGAATLARGYARARSEGLPVPDNRVTALRLALLQVGAFVALEFVERMVSGVPFHHFLLPIVLVGAIAQIAIAAVGTALLTALYRAGAAAARLVAPECAAAVPPIWVPAPQLVVSSRTLEAPVPIRGPPSLLSTA